MLENETNRQLFFTCLIREKETESERERDRESTLAYALMPTYVIWEGECKTVFMDKLTCSDYSNGYQVELVISVYV